VVADLVLIALGIALQPFRLSAFILILSTEGGTKKGLELYAVRAPAASTQLAALRNWLEMHGNEVIIIVCLVLGVWLAGQSIRLLAIEGGR
jgi:hypothetical protein